MMKCSLCEADIESNAIVCGNCGARKTIKRSTVGVFVGWVGMVIALIWLMLGIPLIILAFLGYSLHDFPWITLVVGTLISAALLWYSKSTEHAQWIHREE
jgi:hypothetical protein